MKFYYEIHIRIAHCWQPFAGTLANMFVKPNLKFAISCHCCIYAAKQQGLAPLILLSKVVDFFGSKVSYICLFYPTGCKLRPDEIFLEPSTLVCRAFSRKFHPSAKILISYKIQCVVPFPGKSTRQPNYCPRTKFSVSCLFPEIPPVSQNIALAGVLSIKSVSANFTNVQETQKTDLCCSYTL